MSLRASYHLGHGWLHLCLGITERGRVTYSHDVPIDHLPLLCVSLSGCLKQISSRSKGPKMHVLLTTYEMLMGKHDRPRLASIPYQ